MLTADRYRGDVPATYEETRRHKPEWPVEQAAIEAMVTDGPVLDVPLGTGRYVDIYKAKGLQHAGLDISPEMIAEARRKHPDLNTTVGTVFDMPFKDGEFATAVCSRLLNWLEPEGMAMAIAELRRVAKCLVVSIRTGIEGEAGNYTHDLGKFYAAIEGLHIAERRLIRTVASGDFEMFKLQAPTEADLYAQFGRLAIAKRLAARWTAHFGVAPINWRDKAIKAEYWSAERLASLLGAMSADPVVGGFENEIITDDPPRRTDGPLTIIRSQGREALIDGRRRANIWAKGSGVHPVLVVENKCSG
ncbi:MAG: class I SAM-dependent methyltransferase [Minisyncoccia bacterium]